MISKPSWQRGRNFHGVCSWQGIWKDDRGYCEQLADPQMAATRKVSDRIKGPFPLQRPKLVLPYEKFPPCVVNQSRSAQCGKSEPTFCWGRGVISSGDSLSSRAVPVLTATHLAYHVSRIPSSRARTLSWMFSEFSIKPLLQASIAFFVSFFRRWHFAIWKKLIEL